MLVHITSANLHIGLIWLFVYNYSLRTDNEEKVRNVSQTTYRAFFQLSRPASTREWYHLLNPYAPTSTWYSVPHCNFHPRTIKAYTDLWNEANTAAYTPPPPTTRHWFLEDLEQQLSSLPQYTVSITIEGVNGCGIMYATDTGLCGAILRAVRVSLL